MGTYRDIGAMHTWVTMVSHILCIHLYVWEGARRSVYERWVYRMSRGVWDVVGPCNCARGYLQAAICIRDHGPNAASAGPNLLWTS